MNKNFQQFSRILWNTTQGLQVTVSLQKRHGNLHISWLENPTRVKATTSGFIPLINLRWFFIFAFFLLTSSWKLWDTQLYLCAFSIQEQDVLFLIGRLLLQTQAEMKILLLICSRNTSKNFCSYGGVKKVLTSYMSPALVLIICSFGVSW